MSLPRPFVPPNVESPCIRNCCLDDDNVCIGCGRELQEIIAWSTSSDEDKRAILARSSERRRARAAR